MTNQSGNSSVTELYCTLCLDFVGESRFIRVPRYELPNDNYTDTEAEEIFKALANIYGSGYPKGSKLTRAAGFGEEDGFSYNREFKYYNMDKARAFNEITNKINEIIGKGANKIYVGKTSNFPRRKEEHQNEGYYSCMKVAHGNPQSISQLESSILDWLIKNYPEITQNEKQGSAGPTGDSLYVCYDGDDPDFEYQQIEIIDINVD